MNEKSLGIFTNSVIKKTRYSLVIGSSNKAEDRSKTNNFCSMAVLAVRFNYGYKKNVNKYQVARTKKEKHVGNEQLTLKAIQAAEAIANKAGNCREMAAAAIYYALISNTHHLINLSLIYIPIVDHSFVIITEKITNNKIICDPWLIFYSSYNEEAIKVMRAMLANEYSKNEGDPTNRARVIEVLTNTTTPLKLVTALEITTATERMAFIEKVQSTYNNIIDPPENKAAQLTHKLKFNSTLNQIGIWASKEKHAQSNNTYLQKLYSCILV